MVTRNMKIVTPTNISNSKNMKNNNVVKTSSHANITQPGMAGINSSESPNMRYFNGNSYKNSETTKSIQTPKQNHSTNIKNGKKSSQSHMFYNIPTTSVISRKKFYQQHYRYNQHYQHNFLNNNKEVKNNITIKNHMPDFDTANPIDMQKQQNISKVEESLNKVEDYVNNNTTVNANYTCLTNIHDDNFVASINDNYVALSSNRATTEYKLDVVPSTSPNKSEAPRLLASDSPPSSASTIQHNCVGENKDINLDCSSCWTNLVTPQCTDTKSLQSWPWVHISRAESSSISSESSCNSSISASINSNAEKNNIPNVSIATATNSTNKKIHRKNNNNNRGSNADKRCSSPRIKGLRQKRASNISTTTDNPQSKVSLFTESGRKSKFVENHTAMTTALEPNTVTTASATTSAVDSTITATTNCATDKEMTSKSKSSATLAPHPLLAANEFPNIIELPKLSVSGPVVSSISTKASKDSNDNATQTFILTSPANSPTPSTAGSPPSNSYSLDFLHSVGVQMTGGANIPAIGKSNSINTRATTVYNTQNTDVMSPGRNAYAYQNLLKQRPPHLTHGRYMQNCASGVGGVGNNHAREHRGHRFQQHHHHPQQLTIASFMQQELLNENTIGVGNTETSLISGTGDNSGIDVNNNNSNFANQQSFRNLHRRCNNYYTSHYHQQDRISNTQQQSSITVQPSFHSSNENVNVNSRVSRSCGSGAYTQQHSKHNKYQSQQNNGDNSINPHKPRDVLEEAGAGSENNASKGNFSKWSSKQNQRSLDDKRSNCTSSASKHSSSSSTISSASSNSSQTSTPSYRQQRNKSATQMNLVIETLPRKMNTTAAHRLNCRLQQVNYHNPQHHSHYSTAVGSQSSISQQPHQNFHNLTYVNTEDHTTLSSVSRLNLTTTSRSSSPLLSQPVSNATGPQRFDTTSTIFPYTPTQFQTQQQYQQNFVPVDGNLVCCSQLRDAGTPIDSNQPTSNVQSTRSHEYDDSDTSSTNSMIPSQQRHKYQQDKSVSLSSSSSTSSACSSATRNFNGPLQAVPIIAMTQLQSPGPTEYVYNPVIVSASQHYTPQPLVSPQQQSPFQSNGVISMVNVPFAVNNYTDVDDSTKQHLSQKHQSMHPQQRHFYFSSGEHLSATPLSAHVTNGGGYWSPMQHSNFLYPQPANLIPATQCATPTATLSPCFNDRDDQHFHHANVVSQNEVLPLSGHTKRSSNVQMSSTAVISQQSAHQHLRLPQYTVSQGGIVSTGSNVATLRQRNSARSSLQQTPHHHHQMSGAPATSISHVYPQHNLLFGVPPTHIRSSTNASQEYFTHTPPDRFLARAHLIEAKEAPNSLLNNSKWDNLSQGIWNKFINSQQTEETFRQKMRLWRYLYIIIKNTYPRFGLYLVGSTISGFGADTSDVDMCLVSRSTSNVEPRMEALFNLTVLRDYLSKSAEFENFNVIEAKVPILRFRDRIHQLEVDLNFNNCVGIKNTHLLYCYSQLDWRLRPMVLVTKLWAQYHNINNAKNMTISSYSLVLMVIHFLQYAASPAVLPCLHDWFPDKFPLLRSNDFGYVDMNETIGPYESTNTQTIGELFLHFLEYYSCFDYTQFAISVRTGGLLPINVCRLAKSSKNDIHQWKELCIEEPFDLTNTARSVYDFETFERVKAVFVASWRILQETLDLSTIFAPIIIPPSNSIVSTLRNPTIQYKDSQNGMSSGIATSGNNIVNTNGNESTFFTLSDDSNNNAIKNVTQKEIVNLIVDP